MIGDVPRAGAGRHARSQTRETDVGSTGRGRARWTLSLQFQFLQHIPPELIVFNPMGIVITYLQGDRGHRHRRSIDDRALAGDSAPRLRLIWLKGSLSASKAIVPDRSLTYSRAGASPMPSQPAWFHRLDEILSALRSIDIHSARPPGRSRSSSVCVSAVHDRSWRVSRDCGSVTPRRCRGRLSSRVAPHPPIAIARPTELPTSSSAFAVELPRLSPCVFRREHRSR